MKKLIIDVQNIHENPKDVFEDTLHEDLVALLPVEEYDDMEVKGMEIVLEQLAEEIESELAENDKVADVAENLGDIADALDNSGNDRITPTEAQLIASSANMAVAGTDGDAADLAPALEAFKDKTIAIEQLRQKQKIAYESIADSIKNVIDKINGFIKNLFSFASKMESRINSIKSLVESLDQKKNVTVNIRKNFFFKKNGTDYVGSAKEYKELLEKSVTFFDSFSTLAIRSVTDFTDSYKNFYKTLPGSEATFEEASRLYELYMATSKEITKLPGMKERKLLANKTKSYISDFYLGGTAIRATIYDDVPVNEDNIPEMKNAISKTNIIFARWSDSGSKQDTSKVISFEVNKKYLQDLISQSEKALQIFKRFLDKTYKSNVFWSTIDGLKIEWNGKLMSLHTLIVNRGTNHTIMYISYAREFSKLLTSAPLDLVEKLAKNKAWTAEASE